MKRDETLVVAGMAVGIASVFDLVKDIVAREIILPSEDYGTTRYEQGADGAAEEILTHIEALEEKIKAAVLSALDGDAAGGESASER